jgi:hypothetical protein
MQEKQKTNQEATTGNSSAGKSSTTSQEAGGFQSVFPVANS